MAQTLRFYTAMGLHAAQLLGFHLQLRLFGLVSHFGVSSLLPTRTPDRDTDEHSLQALRDVLRVNEDSTSQSFTLPDGRKFGFACFGAQNGPTVFYLHGLPGSRLSGVLFDGPGRTLGARIVAVERPGVGISSPLPGRTLGDHANDIRQLAEHLGVKAYGIIGVSGGGPYALACAYSLPEENLKSVSVVCGMGPIDVGTEGMNWSNRLLFKGLVYFPALVRWLQNKVVSVLRNVPNEKIVDVVTRRMSGRSFSWLVTNDADMRFLRDPEFLTMMLNFDREHYRQGVDGFMEEGRVLTRDWGFRVEDIRTSIPIQMWYSKRDTNVPLRMGEALAARLGSRPDLHVIQDETHLGLMLNYGVSALERLLEKM